MSEGDRDLPPVQYLIMEVLSARTRLGETWWTFPNSVRMAAEQLYLHELVELKESPAPRAFMAMLTDKGRAEWLTADYVSPFAKPIERVRRLAESAQDDGVDLMRLAPSQVLAALAGRI